MRGSIVLNGQRGERDSDGANCILSRELAGRLLTGADVDRYQSRLRMNRVAEMGFRCCKTVLGNCVMVTTTGLT
jgi:hypothetical protein